MPSFWDFARGGSSSTGPHHHHNLQDGLFQIASQTCSILVKVNNTNNISYVGGSTTASASRSDEAHLHYDFVGNGSASGGGGTGGTLQRPAKASLKKSSISGYRQRLSTVLESTSFGNASATDDEFDQWEQSFMLRQDHGRNSKKWGSDVWCRPSCIPISFILLLIILVVLVPLLEHTSSISSVSSKQEQPLTCLENCRIVLVETIPEGMIIPPHFANILRTDKSWLRLISLAQSKIELVAYYWTLRLNEVYTHNSSIKGEEVFQALYRAGKQDGIKVNIVQNYPSKFYPQTDTETLSKRNAAKVRSVNFSRLLGKGVLHTKLWIVDRTHFYVGSANMDWRALTHMKELGIMGINCSCLAQDLGKIFDVYWSLGRDDSFVPNTWPATLATKFNMENPMSTNVSGHHYLSYTASSPLPLNTFGRTNDIDCVIDLIEKAESFIYISVTDYYPLFLHTPKIKFWPLIDDALRTAALENHVKIKMLIGYWWNYTSPEDYFLRSLTALSQSYPNVEIEVKRYVVPASAEQLKIPHARVSHNKYMVTDKVAYVGTSNWSGDYFVDSGGIGVVLEEPDHPQFATNTSEPGIRLQLQEVFERDWNSPYALNLLQ